jgi:copper(I)-binding protein
MKILFTLISIFLFSSSTATADESVRVGDIVVSKAWGRATIGASRPGGAFLTITNKGTAKDQLIAAQTPIARKSELHTHTMTDSIMKMGQVMSIGIPAEGMTILEPGGVHVMMFNLKAALNEGDMFPLTLTFKDSGKATIIVHVGKAGAMNSVTHRMDMAEEEHMKEDATEAQ